MAEEFLCPEDLAGAFDISAKKALEVAEEGNNQGGHAPHEETLVSANRGSKGVEAAKEYTPADRVAASKH